MKATAFAIQSEPFIETSSTEQQNTTLRVVPAPEPQYGRTLNRMRNQEMLSYTARVRCGY